MKVSIFGLGYVGTVSAVCLADLGHQAVGVDHNPCTVQSINEGRAPIVEPGVEDLLRRARAGDRLRATDDVEAAVLNSDISLVCAETSSNSDGSLNDEKVMAVAEQIGNVLRTKSGYHGIAIRSAVLPGTAERFASIVERVSGKREHEEFGVASNPEFLREGTSVVDFRSPPYTVVGTSDDGLAKTLLELYRGVNAPFHRVRTREAELLKSACDSFQAVKMTFANEIGAICKKFDTDSHVVMKIFAEDRKQNISPGCLKPAFAFGGSRLPKSVHAITQQSRALDVSTPLLNSLLESNEVQIQRVIDSVIERKRRRIGVLGLGLKRDTDDPLESPIVKVVATLIEKGFSVAVFDPNPTAASRLEQAITHGSCLVKDDLNEVLEQSDVVLITESGREFHQAVTKFRPDQAVLDLVRIAASPASVAGQYEGIGW
ncbi:MAG: algD [Mycobacterium sp.]|nr:algD [Mycobacterium sp.]